MISIFSISFQVTSIDKLFSVFFVKWNEFCLKFRSSEKRTALFIVKLFEKEKKEKKKNGKLHFLLSFWLKSMNSLLQHSWKWRKLISFHIRYVQYWNELYWTLFSFCSAKFNIQLHCPTKYGSNELQWISMNQSCAIHQHFQNEWQSYEHYGKWILF